MRLEAIILKHVVKIYFSHFNITRIVTSCLMLLFCCSLSFLLYFIASLFSIKLNKVIDNNFENHFLTILTMFFLLDLFLRIIIQKGSNINFSSYYKIGVPVKTIRRVFMTIGVFNFNNFFSVAFLIFLGVQVHIADYLSYFSGSVFLVLTLNSTSLVINILSYRHTIIKFISLIFSVTLFISVYLNYSVLASSVTTISIRTFSFIFLLLFITSFYFLSKFFSNTLLADTTPDNSNGSILSGKSNWLNNLPQWFLIEYRFMFRNYRVRLLLISVLLLPLMILAHTHNFTIEDRFNNFFMTISCATIFTASYGQFIFSWNTGFISLLISLSDKATARQYIV